MNIYALSDMHGKLPDVPECDICIIAGDVCPTFNHDLFFQLNWLNTNFKNWLESIPAKHIIGIAGNHDLIYATFLKTQINLPWNYLHDEMIEIEGLKIYGTPYQKKFGNWAFMHNEEKLEELWSKIPKCDILVVHGPPYGAGDIVIKSDDGDFHQGSKSLTKRLKELQIPICICGHIHNGWGVYDLNGTTVYNVSVVNERYIICRQPSSIRI